MRPNHELSREALIAKADAADAVIRLAAQTRAAQRDYLENRRETTLRTAQYSAIRLDQAITEYLNRATVQKELIR